MMLNLKGAMNENNRKEIGRRVRNKMELLAKSGRAPPADVHTATPRPVRAAPAKSRSTNSRRRSSARSLNGVQPVGAASEFPGS